MEIFMLYVGEYEYSDELFYEQVPVLKYTVKYPQFSANGVSHFVGQLNSCYRKRADAAVQLCKDTYYQEAAAEYVDLQKAGLPFRENEFYSDYHITNNHNHVMSLYIRESLEGGRTGVGGGAETTASEDGNTEKGSNARGNISQIADTWDLDEGRLITLAELFPGDLYYQEEVLEEINSQIAWQIAHEGAGYYADYRELTQEHFDAYNFYLTPKLLCLFFQQMTIAPYSEGVITFTIPFAQGPIFPKIGLRSSLEQQQIGGRGMECRMQTDL